MGSSDEVKNKTTLYLLTEISYKAEICTQVVSTLNFYDIEKCDDVNTNKNDVIIYITCCFCEKR